MCIRDSFNTALLFITVTMLKDRMQVQKERCLAEYQVIACSLLKDMQALDNRGLDVDQSLAELLLPYTRFSLGNQTTLAIYHGQEQRFPLDQDRIYPCLLYTSFLFCAMPL